MEKETPEVSEETKKHTNRLYELMKTCNNPDKPNPKAREEMQALIRNHPACKAFMQKQEGLYSVALRNRINAGKQYSDSFKEVADAKCEQLRDQLGYPSAGPLERLAIQQIVLCWLNYHQTELSHASVTAQTSSRESGLYWEKRLSFASQRYTRALETLSKMRKMNLVLQVNNAQNQLVNNR